MYDDNTWHMTQNEQFISLCIAALVCLVIGMLVWFLIREVISDDTLDIVDDELLEMAEDLYEDRDLHSEGLLGERWSN